MIIALLFILYSMLRLLIYKLYITGQTTITKSINSLFLSLKNIKIKTITTAKIYINKINGAEFEKNDHDYNIIFILFAKIYI